MEGMTVEGMIMDMEVILMDMVEMITGTIIKNMTTMDMKITITELILTDTTTAQNPLKAMVIHTVTITIIITETQIMNTHQFNLKHKLNKNLR
jgi:hypothetical protein